MKYHVGLDAIARHFSDDPMAAARIRGLAGWCDRKADDLNRRYPLAEDWDTVVFTALYRAAYTYRPTDGTTFLGWFLHILDDRIGPMLKTFLRRNRKLPRADSDAIEWQPCPDYPDPGDGLVSLVQCLTDGEAEVLGLTAGIDGAPPRTCGDAGHIAHMSKQSAYRARDRAVAKLRGEIEGRYGEIE